MKSSRGLSMLYTAPMEFKLISAPDQDIFQQRLTDFIASLGSNVTIGNINFSTAIMPNGDVLYSVLLTYRKTQDW
jgi:hypothetical protein